MIYHDWSNHRWRAKTQSYLYLWFQWVYSEQLWLDFSYVISFGTRTSNTFIKSFLRWTFFMYLYRLFPMFSEYPAKQMNQRWNRERSYKRYLFSSLLQHRLHQLAKFYGKLLYKQPCTNYGFWAFIALEDSWRHIWVHIRLPGHRRLKSHPRVV